MRYRLRKGVVVLAIFVVVVAVVAVADVSQWYSQASDKQREDMCFDLCMGSMMLVLLTGAAVGCLSLHGYDRARVLRWLRGRLYDTIDDW